MDPLTTQALITAAGSIGSSMLNKQANEEEELMKLIQGLNPAGNLQTLEQGFTVPGLGQQLIGGR